MAKMSDFVLIKCISSKSPYQCREKRKAVSDQKDKHLHIGGEILDKH